MKRIVIFLLVMSILLPTSIFAANHDMANNFQQFTQELTEAYASYRMALFQTNKQDQEMSLKGATAFQQQWQAILDRYTDSPPEVFAADPQWKPTLERIGQIVTKSLEEIRAGQLGEAHETLEAVREKLGELRRRNSVIMFSDHINAYHEVMEHLMDSVDSSEALDVNAMQSVREQLGVLDFLAENIRENAPQAYIDNEQFQQLLNGVFASLTMLREGLDNNDPQAIFEAIQNLKAPYAKLFANFG